MAAQQGLLLFDSPTVSAAQVSQSLGLLPESVNTESMYITTLSAHSVPALQKNVYDTVASFAATSGHHASEYLGLLAAAMRPGGRLLVVEQGAQVRGADLRIQPTQLPVTLWCFAISGAIALS